MRFSVAAAAAGLAGVAAAQGSWPQGGSWPPSNGSWGGVSYVTEVVTAFTTYCPEATTLTHNSQTYTVTKPTTLTITNCPCTVTKPVTTSVATSCPPTYSSKPAVSGVIPPPISKPVGSAPASGTGVWTTPVVSSTPSTSPITPAKGAANQLSAGVAGVLALVGLAAAL